MIKQILIICCTILISVEIAMGIAPKGTKVKALQFDSIIELNSINMNTHVLLFVRYLVSQKSYKTSIIWAEPHVGTLNYPIYPPTTIIDSNDKSFSIINQINNKFNTNYSKPIGKRGTFKYMFGDYPIGDIRFTESEALDSRIYNNDLIKLSEPNNNWQTIDVPKAKDSNSMIREVAKLNIQADNRRINALKLLDSKGYLIKSIDYEYSDEKDTPLLKKQNVLLPERPFKIGFQKGGIKLTINGQEQVIKEMVSAHHKGNRKCTVDYEQIKIGDKSISLPVKVNVYSGDGKTLLRASKLMNFKQVNLEENENNNSINDFASFDKNEIYVREMLSKYWMENPEKIANDDFDKIRKIQKQFNETTVGAFAGDELRRINMLLQLDWILGDNKQLPIHYQKYLTILKENKFEQMLLEGGQNAIETTFRWNYFNSADKLLNLWIKDVLSLQNQDSILRFAQNKIKNQRFWETVNLLEKSLESPQTWGHKQIYAEFLHSSALYGLYEMILTQDKITSNSKKRQINWVLTKTNMDDLLKTLKQSITNAQTTISKLENPDKNIQDLKIQLDEISQKISNTELIKTDALNNTNLKN